MIGSLLVLPVLVLAIFSNIFLFLEFPVRGAAQGIIPVQLPVGFTGQGKVGLTLKICGEDSVRSKVVQGGYMCGLHGVGCMIISVVVLVALPKMIAL